MSVEGDIMTDVVGGFRSEATIHVVKVVLTLHTA